MTTIWDESVNSLEVRDSVAVERQSLTLYHASDKVVDVRDICFPGPRGNCDFGEGFYLAESKQTAEEWVINRSSPVVNVYKLEVSRDGILHLSGTDWIKVVV